MYQAAAHSKALCENCLISENLKILLWLIDFTFIFPNSMQKKIYFLATYLKEFPFYVMQNLKKVRNFVDW